MTTHFTSQFRRPIGVLVGLSLVVSMLVVSPIRSQELAPDYLASFDACPEDVIPDGGFRDVPSRHENALDINCIAYYGITKGTSATTYSPTDPVIREHMALFLVRLAKLVDIYIPPPGSTPFTDIGNLSQESRDAISQIFDLGITIGASATTYAPARNVSRGEMALFLQRLMNRMEVVADGRETYGYTPDDVDVNRLNADVEAPWRDIQDVPFAVNEAVTELYELGVASGFGGSSRIYGPDRDMSRADMAAFMAKILDHSNLRPRGTNIQVSPTQGADDFDITAMISVRSDTFVPEEGQAVDWFYTDDPTGGLERNGECDISEILDNGDCVWDDTDDETDREGNIFAQVRATPGALMTFYAWIGSRSGARFDDDTVDFSLAEAQSDKGASNLLVTHDVPVNAWQIGGPGGEYIVDMTRRSSVEFTIQLQDEFGNDLESEGVVIAVEVDSREILVDATNVNNGKPDPTLRQLGRDPRDDFTLVTDRRGEAVFELDGPSRDERLDDVTFETDCCIERIQIAWSEGDSVLVSAKPAFNLYQRANAQNEASFTVEFNLYDQYGNALRGLDTRYTGRVDSVYEALEYQVYEFRLADNVYTGQSGVAEDSVTANFRQGRLRATVEATSLTATSGYVIEIKPNICSTGHATEAQRCTTDDTDTDKIDYAENQVVWIVKDATSANDHSTATSLASIPSGLSLEEVELHPAANRFRTFFTLWSYDSGDRFQVDGTNVGIDEFEREWARVVRDAGDIEILLYGDPSFFLIR